MAISTARRAALRRRLLAWYDAGHRRLPWRAPQRGADPYRVWLAEVMLQQTQVATVVPYFERFVGRFPSLAALAEAAEDEVLALWSGLGYYARGRNLLAAAREARARHGGLPASLEALRALPGFGPYTAGAVASIAFAIPAPAVDGNVSRVLARLFAVDGDPAAGPFRRRIEEIAGDLVGAAQARRPLDKLGVSGGSGSSEVSPPLPRSAGERAGVRGWSSRRFARPPSSPPLARPHRPPAASRSSRHTASTSLRSVGVAPTETRMSCRPFTTLGVT